MLHKTVEKISKFLEDEIIEIEDGITYRKDNIITINVELKPIGGLNQTFIFKGNK